MTWARIEVAGRWGFGPRWGKTPAEIVLLGFPRGCFLEVLFLPAEHSTYSRFSVTSHSPATFSCWDADFSSLSPACPHYVFWDS